RAAAPAYLRLYRTGIGLEWPLRRVVTASVHDHPLLAPRDRHERPADRRYYPKRTGKRRRWSTKRARYRYGARPRRFDGRDDRSGACTLSPATSRTSGARLHDVQWWFAASTGRGSRAGGSGDNRVAYARTGTLSRRAGPAVM